MALRIILVFVAILLIIQLFHSAKNIHPGTQPNSVIQYGIPQNVHSILQKACYDCHSNNTRYPWYNNIQPIAWWLNQHIQEGKRELNFDEFATYPLKKQLRRLEGTAKLVKEDKMPLKSYLWIHKEAKLTMEEKKLIGDWSQSLKQQLQQ
jgi:hypothetical protein